ncbi:MAG: hypothetical protein JWQ56_3555 [Pseudarthrobacter sp.]|nr:hypothetical protein [Pseudarthrobacter sp.]
MKDISELQDQLFETYAAAASKEIPGEVHLQQLLDGYLTLPPHTPQKIGPEFLWSADPLDDANWRFQYHSLLWLDNLREHCVQASSRPGLVLYERLLKDWIEQNPIDAPKSDYSWFDMAVGIRIIVLVQAMTHFGSADWLIASIATHAEHLADQSHYEGKGNHSLHQDMGLIVGAQLLERQDWIDLAVRRITSMFAEAIDSEGVSREGSVDYQYRNYKWYEEAARRLRAAGMPLPPAFKDTLQKMPLFMAHATSPSTNYALIGDTVLHRAPAISGTPAAWTLERDQAPVNRVAVYKSGYLFARSDWTTWAEEPATSFFTLRFGPGRSTAVHGHEDAGSLTYEAHGERLLCDSGLYAYEAGDERIFFRGRSSHNVVDVPGCVYYPSAESPLVAHSVTDDHVMATVQVRGLKSVVWHRTVLHSLTRGYILIDDRVSGASENPVLQRWQLAADSTVEVDPKESNCVVRTKSGNKLMFSSLGHSPSVHVNCGNTGPIRGWRSDKYGEKYPSPELVFQHTGSSVRFSTLIQAASPTQDDKINAVDVERTSKQLRLSLVGSGWREDIALASDGFSSTGKSDF